MANANSPFGFRPFKRNGGLAFVTNQGTAGGTVSEGDLLVSSSGKLVIHTAGADEKIVGVAAHAAVADGSLAFYPPGEGNIFQAQNIPSTALTIANSFVAYEVSGTTGVQGVNTSAATNPVVRVVGFQPNTEVGAYAILLVTIVVRAYDQE